MMFRDSMKVLGVRRIEMEGRLTLLGFPSTSHFGACMRANCFRGGSVMPCPALKRHAAGTGKAHYCRIYVRMVDLSLFPVLPMVFGVRIRIYWS